MTFNTYERITLEKALKLLWDACVDEIHEKKDVPGEKAAVEDDRFAMKNIDQIVEKLGPSVRHPSSY